LIYDFFEEYGGGRNLSFKDVDSRCGKENWSSAVLSNH